MKPRALFIGPLPPPYSGPESSMKALLESSLAERFEISFLKTNVRPSNVAKGRMDQTLVLAFFRFIWRLVGLILRKRPQVAYYFVTATRLGWLGRDIWCILICRAFGVPIVLHMRAGHFKRNFTAMRPFEQRLIRFACQKASRGLTQAGPLKEQFRGLVPDERIFAVHNAIDTKLYSNHSPESYDPDMVIFLGHLSHAKGYCDLLKALPLLAKRHPGCRLVFAGDKLNQERNVFHNEVTGEPLAFEDPDQVYERFVKGRCEENYKYLGTIGEQEKLRLFRECNFLVLPSYSEGFSMAVLEALAMGKPVVCTPVGALKEIVRHGENGFLVQPGDISGLVEKMSVLVSNPDLRNEMARRNLKYAKKNFDIAKISREIGDHLEAVMKTRT